MLNLTTPHNQYSNVLLVVPRYSTYGATGHYVMPMGTLYVSAYLKAAAIDLSSLLGNDSISFGLI